MRFLYHHRTRGQDAQGIHIRELTSALRRLGHEVVMVALLATRHTGGSPAKSTAEPSSLPHWLYELAALGYNVPAFVVLLWRSARFRPDVIYERYSLFAGAGLIVARILRIPFFLEVNSPLSLEMRTYETLTFERLARRMEIWVCSNATRTIVVTGVMKRMLTELGVPAEKFLVMPNGVDERAFHDAVDGAAVVEHHGLQRAFVVGFVGWIRPWHGVDTLLRAAAKLTRVIPTLKLLIVGDGPAVPALHELAREIGIEETVVFVGSVEASEIPAHIAAMDVAVQPNVTEYASPIKLFEYLAIGRAVVAPDKPNIREVVEDGETALIYTAGNPEELAERIQQLFLEPELRARLGAAAAKLVEKRNYSWLGNAERLVESVRSTRAAQSLGSASESRKVP